MRQPLIMGNWKLNGNQKMVTTMINELNNTLHSLNDCQVVIAPPTAYLYQAYQLINHPFIALGAQDVDIHLSGAFTGETSAEMLKDIGVKYSIIGHSERRSYHHESDAIVAEKFALLTQIGLVPVLCIGESEQENLNQQTETVCARQIDAIIHKLNIDAFKNAVIAYEPIWAIGTGKSATPEQAQNVHYFIRQHLAYYNSTIAKNITILYGGSVNDKNAAELFSQPDIDGALVGGASLKADSFLTIIQAANMQ